MNLSIKEFSFYIDNLFLCHCEAGNGRAYLPVGRYEVSTQFSHHHGKTLPNADGLGWIGASPECDAILVSVRNRNESVPSHAGLGRLLAILEVAEDSGRSVVLEVE